MKSLDIYLARAVFVGIVIALLIICAVDWLGDLFYQVSRMDAGDKFSDVLLITLLDIPHKFFEFLPSSMLIGTLFSLGQFAASSELVAVGASGYSRLRVGVVSCVTGLLITLIMSLFIEFYIPYGERLSLSLNQSKSENVLLASDQSYWVRDQSRFIRVGQAVSKDLLNNIEIYQFDDEGGMSSISRIESAIKDGEEWRLQKYRSTHFSANKVSTDNVDSRGVQAIMFSNLLQSVTSDPVKMSVQKLYEYIFYLQDNHLDASEYKVAMYKRIAIPFVGLAMLLLALPLIFRPRQLGGAGQRLLIGIVVALLVYIILEAISNGAVVFQFAPVLVAFLPVIVILLCSFAAFKLIR